MMENPGMGRGEDCKPSFQEWRQKDTVEKVSLEAAAVTAAGEAAL